MPDIIQINVNDTNYNLIDDYARHDIDNLIQTLGGLAYKDSAAIQPGGVIKLTGASAVDSVVITPAYIINDVGTLPSVRVDEGINSATINFIPGTLPSKKQQDIISNITLGDSFTIAAGTTGVVK